MVQLLIKRWCEPPVEGALHLSTLVQQTLSALAQRGGARAEELWKTLCQTGPFVAVGQVMFAEFLRSLAQHDLVVQSSDGILLPGERGEILVNHYDFYSAFATGDEYRIEHDGRALGSIPISHALIPGQMLIFAGRRWTILHVDEEQRRIAVAPAKGGSPPKYGGGGARIHDRVREEMFGLYVSRHVPAFLDAGAQTLLAQGREAFGNLRLAERRFIENGAECLVFLWAGDRTLDTILALLGQRSFSGTSHQGCLVLSGTDERGLVACFEEIAAGPPPNSRLLAGSVANKRREKHDGYLSEPLLCADYASRDLDVPAALRVVRRTLDGLSPISN
jgi:ATP-dependent Lhr-like helicase